MLAGLALDTPGAVLPGSPNFVGMIIKATVVHPSDPCLQIQVDSLFTAPFEKVQRHFPVADDIVQTFLEERRETRAVGSELIAVFLSVPLLKIIRVMTINVCIEGYTA